LKPEQTILVNLSGRGDKDVQSVADAARPENATGRAHGETVGGAELP
jgi:hypothetical protein